MNTLQVQRLTHGGDFFHEALDSPQGDILGLIGFAAAELIVQDDSALGSQRLQWFKIIVSGTRAPVESQERDGVPGADDFVPYLTSRNSHIALTGWLGHLVNSFLGSEALNATIAVGRAGTRPPPAPIPACGITAPGSSEILTSHNSLHLRTKHSRSLVFTPDSYHDRNLH